MKKLGKTFAAELSAAGLLGLPFSWGEDGALSFGETLTEAQRSAIQAVYDAHVAPSDLDDAKAAALAAIDAGAGAARARYITVAPGQEATYILKAQQAAAFKAGGYSGPAPGLVQAEMDATGATAQAAADDILAQEAAWAWKAAQIESARRRGKVAAGNAADAAGVEAVRAAAIAELGAL